LAPNLSKTYSSEFWLAFELFPLFLEFWLGLGLAKLPRQRPTPEVSSARLPTVLLPQVAVGSSTVGFAIFLQYPWFLHSI